METVIGIATKRMVSTIAIDKGRGLSNLFLITLESVKMTTIAINS